MRICKTCDTATEAFRKALLLGHTAVAMSAYSTGCVNLCRPYTIYHGELPVHCAASGGNMGLLSWLVDEMGCQLFMDHDKKVGWCTSRQRAAPASLSRSSWSCRCFCRYRFSQARGSGNAVGQAYPSIAATGE
ncbi:unnamed protein product [Scytosiphon promiscuus]